MVKSVENQDKRGYAMAKPVVPAQMKSDFVDPAVTEKPRVTMYQRAKDSRIPLGTSERIKRQPGSH